MAKDTNKREAVLISTEGKCWYCGVELTLEEPYLPHSFTLDHIEPLKYGGNSHISNLTAACRRCNSSKGSKSIEEFRIHMMFKQAELTPFTTDQIIWLVNNGVEISKLLSRLPEIIFWGEKQDEL